MKRNEAYLTRKQIRKIINMAETDRDHLILRLLANTGIRSFELTNIDIRDIKFEDRQIYIKYGKYGKDRMVPVDEGTLNEIRRFIGDRKKGFLFRSSDKRRDKITTKLVNDICKKYGKKAGIEHPYPKAKYINPHLFRHSAIRFWLKQGLPHNYVSKIAGHSSTAFTMDVYGKPTAKDVEEEFRKIEDLV